MSVSWLRLLMLVPALSLPPSLLATVGCAGGSDNGGNGGGAGSGGSGTGSVFEGASLTVNAAALRSSLNGTSPQQGRSFLRLDITLANQSVAQPLRADLTLFSVSTAGNLSVLASPSTALLDNECTADLAVAEGGSISCGLAFEVPDTDQATELVYDDPVSGARLVAAIPAPEQLCVSLGQLYNDLLPQDCAECVGYYCEPMSFECFDDPCLQGCTTCPCEDACNVAACAGTVETFRACVRQTCEEYCAN